MRGILAGLFVLVAFHGAVHAQTPSQSPYPPPPYPGQPYPGQPYPGQPYPGQPYPGQPYPGQPYPGVAPAYQYVPAQLTEDEQRLLAEGEISDNRYIGGALVSVFFGWGLGQAVQGRYRDTGWIFTVGEGASTVALFAGFVQTFGDCFDVERSCNNRSGETLLIGGAIGLVVFRAWELIDVFTVPPRHNARVRELRLRLGMPPPMYSKKLQPYIVPTLSRDGGAVAGLTLRF